jgi:hypothetical protein
VTLRSLIFATTQRHPPILDGADYGSTYDITVSCNALTINFVTTGPYSVNIGSCVYLVTSGDTAYQMFKRKEMELTCGMVLVMSI